MSCPLSVSPFLPSSCVQTECLPSQTLLHRDRGQLQPREPRRETPSSSRARIRTKAFAILAVLILSVAASAQVQFGSQPVGSPATQAVNVTVPVGVTVNSVQVLTLGSTGKDFQPQGTFNCAAPTCTQSVIFTALYPGLRLGAVVALDSTNTVLGTTYISGIGAGGLGVLLPGTIRTIAGDGDWQSESDDKAAIFSELSLPTAVALDGAGNVYIADSDHAGIRIVCAAAGTAFPNITCRQPGYIYTVAGVLGAFGYAGDGQPSTSTSVELNKPSGLAIDGAGNLYIADTNNHVVRLISAATGMITTIAGTGVRGFSGDGAAATSAQLNSPTGVALDLDGNVFIADSKNNRIRAICTGSSPIFGVACSAGNIVTVAGSGAATPLGDGAAATAAGLNTPFTMALDPIGNLYIADSLNNRVRLVCASGSTTVLGVACSGSGVIKTVAGNGTGAFKGDNGPAVSAELFAPSGVVVDPAGNLYISDTQNFHIRKVNPIGVITSVAGTGAGSFGGDNGPATSAGIVGSYALMLDGNGNMYIADRNDNRVREIHTNLSIASFKSIPVRQGSTSTTAKVTVENDGTGPLDLTSIQAGTNSAIDPSVTTCSISSPLSINAQCVMGAIFAPAASPALTSNQTENGNIDVAADTVPGTAGSNSPLVIQVTGVATPVNSTTVTLTSTLNPSSFGQSVTFAAAVTTGAGTGNLTGTVTFYNGTTKLMSGVPLNASGIANFALSALPVGANSITAAYNEDGKDLLHFGSTSDPFIQVVQEPTAVNLASSANPSALNVAVTFTATVSTPSGGGVSPVGTVSFLDGTNTIGIGTVTAGVATFTTSLLSDGQHAMTAIYNGDTSTYIASSASPVLKQSVLASSTVVVTSSSASNTSVYGTAVTFTATVTGSSTVTPTGTVNFLDGATKIGSATLATGGVATFTTASLSAGAHAITAAYLGDLNSGPGTSAPIVQTVNQTPTTTALSASPLPGVAGKPVTLVASVKLSSGSGISTGSVSFADGATSLGSANLAANGTASIALVLKPGPHAIVATYSGDTNDAASVSAALPLDVNLATTSVAVTSSGSPATVLASITFAAVVTGNGGTPTGSVVFSVDGATAKTVTIDGTGKASFGDSSLAVGNHIITAAYSGDTYDNASASTQFTQAVQAIATTTSLGTASTTGTVPQTLLVATVIAGTGPTPTGTVVFMNGSTPIGTATVDTNGVATLLPDLAPATYNMVAKYSGDSIHGASASSAVKISGTPTGFGMVINPTTISMAATQNTTITITFQSNNGYTDTIGLGCGTLPLGINCHFASSTVALKANATSTIKLTIDTGTPLGAGASAMNSASGPRGFSLAGLFLPAGLLVGWIGWRFRKRNAAFLAVALAALLSSALLVSGCGGFTQKSALPGTYTIQITGVGSNSNISHYQNITLTITK